VTGKSTGLVLATRKAVELEKRCSIWCDFADENGQPVRCTTGSPRERQMVPEGSATAEAIDYSFKRRRAPRATSMTAVRQRTT